MPHNKQKHLWLAFIISLLVFCSSKNNSFFAQEATPAAEALDFNRTGSDQDSRPLIVSPDEKITTEVFEKVHPAVVNIATMTLSYNFWLEVIPSEGQGSGFA